MMAINGISPSLVMTVVLFMCSALSFVTSYAVLHGQPQAFSRGELVLPSPFFPVPLCGDSSNKMTLSLSTFVSVYSVASSSHNEQMPFYHWFLIRVSGLLVLLRISL